MRFVIVILLIGLSHSSRAAFTFVGFGAPPVVAVQVGPATGVATVNFSVPANAVGNGVPVVGSPAVSVAALARHPFSFPLPVFTLSVDSSVPLSNGTQTIPFNRIQWTAAEGSIPSGQFNGSTAQVIMGPLLAIFLVSDTHTFTYANDAVIAAGTYSGRVTYTAALP